MQLQKTTQILLKSASLCQNNRAAYSLLDRVSKFQKEGYIEDGQIALRKYVLPHPHWTTETARQVEFVVPSTFNFGDKFAKYFAQSIQIMNDTFSGYYFKQMSRDPETLKKAWINRIMYMQNIASVPGYIGSLFRHLRYLRRLEEDEEVCDVHGLIKQSENERIHSLIFMAIHKPGNLYKFGMFTSQLLFNLTFASIYLISPRVLNRIQANIEINQINALTELIDQIDRKSGPVSSWKEKPATQMAKDYWEMDENATYLDMVLFLRKDKELHRDYNNEIADDYTSPVAMSKKAYNDHVTHMEKVAKLQKIYQEGLEKKKQQQQ